MQKELFGAEAQALLASVPRMTWTRAAWTEHLRSAGFKVIKAEPRGEIWAKELERGKVVWAITSKKALMYRIESMIGSWMLYDGPEQVIDLTEADHA